jgi:hypothetical protein
LLPKILTFDLTADHNTVKLSATRGYLGVAGDIGDRQDLTLSCRSCWTATHVDCQSRSVELARKPQFWWQPNILSGGSGSRTRNGFVLVKHADGAADGPRNGIWQQLARPLASRQ